MRLSRRAVLGLGATAVVLAGCGEDTLEREEPEAPAEGSRRVRYGEDHPDQFADLRLPDGDPVGTVVLLHGGYWLPMYGLDQLDPMAEELTRAGWATWNVEYRRTGAGGGVPNTLTDLALAMDRLAQDDLGADLARNVVTLGHSAGGHLSVWAASRTAQTPGGEPRVVPTAAISLSGVLDLTLAAGVSGSAEPVTAFVGGTPEEVPERYDLADPTLLVPAACPVHVVQAEDDMVVPLEQATSYVDHAEEAGAPADLVEVPGDHYTIIETDADSFTTIRRLLDDARA